MDLEFSNIIETNTTEFKNYTATHLEEDTTYYWRVRETNSCNTGENSLIYTFQTGLIEEFNFSNNSNVNIPDNDPSGIDALLNIPDKIEITDINVTLNISHSYVGDLKITLKNPAGDEVVFVQNSSKEGSNYTNTTFDDSAALTIIQGNPPYTGSFKPVDLLAAYNGTQSKGNWTLHISDNEADDEGKLLDWKITILGIDQNSLSDDDIPEVMLPKVTKAFSPNGDTINDTWIIENINTTNFEHDKFPSANVKIFNIRGQLLYQATNYKNDWNGVSSTGKKLTIGTYIYEVSFSKPEFKTQKGWIYIKY